MFMTEYDREYHMKLERKEHFERGKAVGEQRGIQQGTCRGKADSICLILKTKGTIPKELAQRISSERDLKVLDVWLMLAIKVSSIEEFQEMFEK